MVGGYTEDLTKPRNCENWGQLHAQDWVLACIHTFAVVYEEKTKTWTQLIPCCQTNIFRYVHSVVGQKWGALTRAVIMSQESTQPSMQMFPGVTHYFRTGLVMTLQFQCICISYKEELNCWTHPLSMSFWRLWFTWKTFTSVHTPSAEILLPLRLQKVRQHWRELLKLHHQCTIHLRS